MALRLFMSITAYTSYFSVTDQVLIEKINYINCSVNLCLACAAFSSPFGVENVSVIQSKYMIASNVRAWDYAYYGRLNFASRSWSAEERYGTTYLEISFRRQLSVFTAVATQGNVRKQEWVKSYKLSFSRWGDEWMTYTEDGEAKVRSILLPIKEHN